MKKELKILFTDDAKKQLEELKTYYNASSLLEVIKLGISFLQRIKEYKEKKIDN